MVRHMKGRFMANGFIQMNANLRWNFIWILLMGNQSTCRLLSLYGYLTCVTQSKAESTAKS